MTKEDSSDLAGTPSEKQVLEALEEFDRTLINWNDLSAFGTQSKKKKRPPLDDIPKHYRFVATIEHFANNALLNATPSYLRSYWGSADYYEHAEAFEIPKEQAVDLATLMRNDPLKYPKGYVQDTKDSAVSKYFDKIAYYKRAIERRLPPNKNNDLSFLMQLKPTKQILSLTSLLIYMGTHEEFFNMTHVKRYVLRVVAKYHSEEECEVIADFLKKDSVIKAPLEEMVKHYEVNGCGELDLQKSLYPEIRPLIDLVNLLKNLTTTAN